MRILFLIVGLLALHQFVFGQPSESIRKELKLLEETSIPKKVLYVELENNRWSEENSISIEALQKELKRTFEKDGYSIREQKPDNNIPFLHLLVRIDYLNFYKNSSKRMYGKGYLEVEILNSVSNSRFSSTSDILFKKKKLKNYSKENTFIKCQDVVLKQLVIRFSDKLKKFTDQLLSSFCEVICYGEAPIQSTFDLALKKAKYNAMERASVKVDGVEFKSSTKMIDFGDVTQKTTTESISKVLSAELLESYPKRSKDNVCFVLMKILIEK